MERQRRTGRRAVLVLVAAGLAAVAPAATGPGSGGPAPAVEARSRTGSPASPSQASRTGVLAPPTQGSAPAAFSPSAATNPPEVFGTSDGREAVLDVYRRRSSALAASDRSAWASTVADPASEAGRLQLVAYDHLRALGVTELTVGDVGSPAHSDASASDDGSAATSVSGRQEGRPSSAASFVVSLGHRIPGFDRGPRFAARTVTLEPGTSGWRIVSDRSATDQLQVWDLPELRVQRSDTVLVAGNVDAGVLTRHLADAESGQEQVGEVLAAPVPAVLVVPRTAQEAARQLGRSDGTALGRMAASTDGGAPLPAETGPTRSAAQADRVILNPDAFVGLTDQGRQVVVAHELAHVTARALMPGRVPLWLSEGLAEYVAWRRVDMPVRTAAAVLLAQVRSAEAPLALPADGDFDPARGDVAVAYQAAWLAVRHLAGRHADERLLAFYRAVGDARGESTARTPVESAFTGVLGTTVGSFEGEWRAYVEQLAR